MGSTRSQTFRTEEVAKRIEQELIDAGRQVKRQGRTVTQFLSPKQTKREKKYGPKHKTKRERDYGFARTEDS